MEWISVKERLPSNYSECLISDGNLIEIGYYVNKKWIGSFFRDEDVTHWMLLVKLPNPHRGSSLYQWIEEEGLDV